MTTGFPAAPPVPLDLLLPGVYQGSSTVGMFLIEAEAPARVGEPACPVCHAAIHYGFHSGAAWKAVCSRSMKATRMSPPVRARGLYCRWEGWVTQNNATKVFLIVGHGPTMPPEEELARFAAWVPV